MIFNLQISEYGYKDDILCSLSHGLLNTIRKKEKVGWLYPKNSMLKRLFDKFLIDTARTGIEDRIRTEYFKPKELTCEVSFNPIGFHMVKTLFKLLALGTSISAVAVIIEKLTFHCIKLV